ncbi:hypothetical protein D9T22_09100 [Klebsiella pneumoniae]|nr:hypothetical protein D9T22_09100 [Klebsiella pneumoniae]
MMSLWDALRMNMMISYQELVRTFLICIYHIVRNFRQFRLHNLILSLPCVMKKATRKLSGHHRLTKRY